MSCEQGLQREAPKTLPGIIELCNRDGLAQRITTEDTHVHRSIIFH